MALVLWYVASYVSFHAEINECSTNNGGCHHYCRDTPGSYYCTCRTGWRLLSDRHTCTRTNLVEFNMQCSTVACKSGGGGREGGVLNLDPRYGFITGKCMCRRSRVIHGWCITVLT